MDCPFDADVFLALLNRGVYEGRLREEIAKLSDDQLEEVALLMAKQLKENSKSGTATDFK
jgi:hypothetical protein